MTETSFLVSRVSGGKRDGNETAFFCILSFGTGMDKILGLSKEKARRRVFDVHDARRLLGAAGTGPPSTPLIREQ